MELRSIPGAFITLNIVGEDRNTPPVADAGPDQSVKAGTVVMLDGSGSTDADGDVLAYVWAMKSRPPGSAAALSDATGTNGKNEHGAQGTARPTEFVGVESILMHESGEFVAERIVIPLTEEKGKTKVQCAGSTLNYLRRYSWASILGMYSDEDSDGSSPVQAFTPKPAALPPPPVKQLQNN